MTRLSLVRLLSVGSALGALVACGGGVVQGAPTSGDAGGDAATAPDSASGDDDSDASGDDSSIADAGPDINQDPNVYPAMHHPLPQVDKGSGPILDHMKIVTVTFGNDANAATYTAFDQAIGGTMWWQQTLSTYGISPGQDVADVVLPDTLSGMQITDQQLQTYLGQEIASGALPEPDTETLYVIYATRDMNVSLALGGTNASSCQGFDGYHNAFGVSVPSATDGGAATTITAAYALVCNCGYGGLNEIEFAASHEIAEAATDPHEELIPTYYLRSDDAWSQVFGGSGAGQGAEVGDLCQSLPAWTESGYRFNTIYTNAAAALSKNPCQPNSSVYFGAAPRTTEKALGGVLSDGFVQAKPGQTSTVILDVFSYAALPNDLNLAVGQPSYYGSSLSPITGGVSTSLSQSTAHNGDGVILSISVDSSTPAGNYPFVVRATLNSNDYNDWAAELSVQ